MEANNKFCCRVGYNIFILQMTTHKILHGTSGLLHCGFTSLERAMLRCFGMIQTVMDTTACHLYLKNQEQMIIDLAYEIDDSFFFKFFGRQVKVAVNKNASVRPSVRNLRFGRKDKTQFVRQRSSDGRTKLNLPDKHSLADGHGHHLPEKTVTHSAKGFFPDIRTVRVFGY